MSEPFSLVLPPWAAEIVARYESGAAGEFILHGNIADRMLLPLSGGSRLGRLTDFLAEVLLPKFSVVISFDPGFGMKIERGREIFGEWPSAKESPELPVLPLQAVRTIGHFLQYIRNVRAMAGKTYTVAVVLRDAQLWLPVLPQTLHHELNAIASVVRSWATDTNLAEHGQAVFLVADRLNHLHPLVAENPRAATVAIPLPP
ncbi:MAG: hypothetical protein JWO82_1020, partial [Akkermansiaceae bacterium]|nr:hypothetical protein [Akkermansiaceae bacterium]